MKTPRFARGVTLVELLVSLVIMSVVMLAVMTVFIAVQRSYETMSRTRSAIEGSRAAVSYVERQVRMAGYGIDPRYAFDFTVSGGLTSKDNMAVSGVLPSTVPVTTDDLAYRYRDPNWLRRGAMSGTTLNLINANGLGATFGLKLQAGQRLMVMCPGGNDWAVFQLNSGRDPTDTSATVTHVSAPFPAPPSCLTQTTGSAIPYVALLQERRIRIRNIGGRPFLVAYRQIRDATGAVVQPDAANLNYDPIAADVEDFQVAYVMNRPGDMAAGPGAFRSACCAGAAVVDSTGNSNWILMDSTSGTEAVPDGNPTATTAPTVDLAYDSPRRYNNHSANIRQVRAAIVVRSQRQDRNQYSRALSVENNVRSSPPLDGFMRLPMTTTIRVPNMLSRSTFTPDLRTSAGEGNFNGG
jgi:type IV pilus assembly protein PilW